MGDFTISTLRSVYITNEPYQYPIPFLQRGSTSKGDSPGSFGTAISTGWHIVPNLLWGHVCSPKQWWEMVLKFEAIKVNSIKCRFFNPIPIQTAVSFQGTSTFPAFNNTVYALGYNDDLYETPWFNWWSKPFVASNKKVDMFYEYNPAYKEGTIPQPVDKPFEYCNEALDTRKQYDTPSTGVFQHPEQWTTKTYQASTNNMVQSLKYRRVFLPIYWYHFPFKQFHNSGNATLNWLQLNTDFEYAYNDISGAFWDPLNRPDDLMELRPGKNMIEFSWSTHEVDSNIWFNTDRIASLTPYGRPRPTDVDPGVWNMPLRVRMIDPRGPGNSVHRWGHLKQFGLVKNGEALTVPMVQMAPEGQMTIPSWRRWPVVPSRWFYKELQQQNPYVYQNMVTRIYAKDVSGCPDPTAGTGAGTTAGDAQITGPYQDIKFPGTEYEQHKYPPTQWFLKTVPLFDNAENRISVEMQMWMHITVNITGKSRRSALYAPSWGPVLPMDLYSVNMDTNFGENYMRVRSGGARRTWYDPSEGPPEMLYNPRHPPGQINPGDSKDGSSTVVPWDISDECTVFSNAVQPEENPIAAVYSKNQTPPSLVVRINGNATREVFEDDFEKIDDE